MGLLRGKRDRGSTEFENTVNWSQTGWRGNPTPAPWQQTGIYGDAILNQVPGIWPSTQLWTGVGSLYPGWIVLSASATPYFQQTQQQGDLPGAQRYAGAPGQAMGPVSARGLRSQVFRAQVQQSGLQVMSWAQALRGWS